MTFGYDAAIFDMDGTLLDSMRYWRYTSLEYLLKHHLPIQPDILTRMIDTSSRKLLGEVMSGLGLPYHLEEAVAELEGYMDRHYQADIQMKPCVPEFLHFLQTQGVKMCVATAVTREIAVRALEKQGIAHLFEFITDIHEFGLDKTQPEYFHVVARRLNCPIQRCMVFEDALYSIQTAQTAGCQVCAIHDDTAHLQQAKILALADVYVRHYRELLPHE